MPEQPIRVGIDLGGTKIEGIALGPGGVELARRRLSTPPGYAATLDALTGLGVDLERDAGGRGTVGMGIPGTVSVGTSLVRNNFV